MTIDWHYTMGLVSRFPVKTHRRLSSCATTMRVRFVYERSRYATMVNMRHGFATLINSNNAVVYGQKHKVWVLVFLVRRAEHFETKIEQVWWNFPFCNKTASSRYLYVQPLHSRNAAKYFIKWVG